MANRPPQRSVSALFRGLQPAGVEDLENAQLIDGTLLSPNPFQPRAAFDPRTLQELARSLQRIGVLQPLLVRPMPGDGERYQIAAGERRWQAAQLAGLAAVPCVVRDLDDDAMEEIALVENIQRDDLTPVEEARVLRRLMERRSLSMRALSEHLGKNHSYVEDKLKLIGDPRIASAVETGALGPTAAAEIAQLDDEEARTDLLARASQGERIRVKDVQARTQRPTPADASPTPAPAQQHGKGTLPDNPAAASLNRAAEAGQGRGEEGSLTPQRSVVLPDNPAGVAAQIPPGIPEAVRGYHGGRTDGHDHDDHPVSDAQAGRSTDSTPPREAIDSNRQMNRALLTVGTPAPRAALVRLRELGIIQLREGQNGVPHLLDEAERAVVLRILRADLAQLEEDEWAITDD